MKAGLILAGILIASWLVASWPVAIAISRRFRRASQQHQLAEAMHAVTPASDIEALIDATREPPPLTDQHADRLLRLVNENDGEDPRR
jgi:hypothetical protein